MFGSDIQRWLEEVTCARKVFSPSAWSCYIMTMCETSCLVSDVQRTCRGRASSEFEFEQILKNIGFCWIHSLLSFDVFYFQSTLCPFFDNLKFQMVKLKHAKKQFVCYCFVNRVGHEKDHPIRIWTWHSMQADHRNIFSFHQNYDLDGLWAGHNTC